MDDADLHRAMVNETKFALMQPSKYPTPRYLICTSHESDDSLEYFGVPDREDEKFRSKCSVSGADMSVSVDQ